MTNLVRAAGLVAVLVLCGAVTVAQEKKMPEAQLLKTITDVKYEFAKDKKSIEITAKAEVPTGGWTKPVLVARTYFRPPADGIYEYDLSAVPPDGFATQVISTVTATLKVENPPAEMKGVKVYGVDKGAKTVKFDEKKDKK